MVGLGGLDGLGGLGGLGGVVGVVGAVGLGRGMYDKFRVRSQGIGIGLDVWVVCLRLGTFRMVVKGNHPIWGSPKRQATQVAF